MKQINKDILHNIVMKLKITDILTLNSVNRHFHRLINQHYLWKRLVYFHFEKDEIDQLQSSSTKQTHKSSHNENDDCALQNYKNLYKLCYQLEQIELKLNPHCSEFDCSFPNKAIHLKKSNQIDTKLTIKKQIYESKSLFCIFGKIQKVPNCISILNNLKNLDLSNNKIKDLPVGLFLLKQLKILYLNGNQIQSLNDEIGQLENLIILNLADNKLVSLPISIGRLKKLQGLHLQNNHLRKLPINLLELENLVICNYSNNLIPYDDEDEKNSIFLKQRRLNNLIF